MAHDAVPHGGGVRAAAARYHIPERDWLDLSTGINPWGYPVGELPARVWQRLPEPDPAFDAAARAYYGSAELVAVPGTQAALEWLPRLRAPGVVGVLVPTYGEYARTFTRAGWRVRPVVTREIEAALPTLDALVITNPNNPTGEQFSAATLRGWHEALARRGGWLIVDEAFADAAPNQSLVANCGAPGLVVLCSLGKFFGLAGLRLGMVGAEPALRLALAQSLGPWAVSHPAQVVATRAWSDHGWQRDMRERLRTQSAELARLLAAAGLPPNGGCALFQWVRTTRAAEWHEHFARRGVLVRLFSEPASLRLGLPGGPEAVARLKNVLQEVAREMA